jgi:hypothetical protein
MLRGHGLVLAVVTLTSLLSVLAGRRWGVHRVGAAIVATVEVVGAAMLFFAANLALGAALVLAIRQLTPFYPSLYEVADVAVLALSLLQALIFESWRHAARGPHR